MKEIKMDNSNQEKHECDSRKEGNWIIYTCCNPDCDYDRRFNVITRKMEFHGTYSEIIHQGKYQPIGVQLDKLNLN